MRISADNPHPVAPPANTVDNLSIPAIDKQLTQQLTQFFYNTAHTIQEKQFKHQNGMQLMVEEKELNYQNPLLT